MYVYETCPETIALRDELLWGVIAQQQMQGTPFWTPFSKAVTC